MEKLIRQRMVQPQLIAVQCRAGDERLVLRAVEPVTGEGTADGGHMEPQLMGTAGDGPQPQQGAAMGDG